jgi:hypothetical protein
MANLSALGENLNAAFPPHLNDMNYEKRLTGTSMATPILAGISGLVIEFSRILKARQLEEGEIPLDILTVEGMALVFEKCMLTDADKSPPPEYYHLDPARLFLRFPGGNLNYKAVAHRIRDAIGTL